MLTVHFMGIVFIQWQPRLKKCAWCSETQSNPQTNCSEASVTFKELGLVLEYRKERGTVPAHRVLQRSWGERPASGLLYNMAKIIYHWRAEWRGSCLFFTGIWGCFLWFYELRLEEIVDTWQQTGGGRCFTKMEEDAQTSRPFPHWHLHGSVVLPYTLPWICPSSLRLFFLVFLSSQESECRVAVV